MIRRDLVASDAQVGQEFHIVVRGRVRRVEAEHLEVTGYTPGGSGEFLEGDVEVEFTVLDVKAVPA